MADNTFIFPSEREKQNLAEFVVKQIEEKFFAPMNSNTKSPLTTLAKHYGKFRKDFGTKVNFNLILDLDDYTSTELGVDSVPIQAVFDIYSNAANYVKIQSIKLLFDFYDINASYISHFSGYRISTDWDTNEKGFDLEGFKGDFELTEGYNTRNVFNVTRDEICWLNRDKDSKDKDLDEIDEIVDKNFIEKRTSEVYEKPRFYAANPSGLDLTEFVEDYVKSSLITNPELRGNDGLGSCLVPITEPAFKAHVLVLFKQRKSFYKDVEDIRIIPHFMFIDKMDGVVKKHGNDHTPLKPPFILPISNYAINHQSEFQTDYTIPFDNSHISSLNFKDFHEKVKELTKGYSHKGLLELIGHSLFHEHLDSFPEVSSTIVSEIEDSKRLKINWTKPSGEQVGFTDDNLNSRYRYSGSSGKALSFLMPRFDRFSNLDSSTLERVLETLDNDPEFASSMEVLMKRRHLSNIKHWLKVKKNFNELLMYVGEDKALEVVSQVLFLNKRFTKAGENSSIGYLTEAFIQLIQNGLDLSTFINYLDINQSIPSGDKITLRGTRLQVYIDETFDSVRSTYNLDIGAYLLKGYDDDAKEFVVNEKKWVELVFKNIKNFNIYHNFMSASFATQVLHVFDDKNQIIGAYTYTAEVVRGNLELIITSELVDDENLDYLREVQRKHLTYFENKSDIKDKFSKAILFPAIHIY